MAAEDTAAMITTLRPRGIRGHKESFDDTAQRAKRAESTNQTIKKAVPDAARQMSMPYASDAAARTINRINKKGFMLVLFLWVNGNSARMYSCAGTQETGLVFTCTPASSGIVFRCIAA